MATCKDICVGVRSVQAWQQLGSSSNLLQDAVYGKSATPDLYVIFRNMINPDSQQAYSHYNLLVSCADDQATHWLPEKADFAPLQRGYGEASHLELTDAVVATAPLQTSDDHVANQVRQRSDMRA